MQSLNAHVHMQSQQGALLQGQLASLQDGKSVEEQAARDEERHACQQVIDSTIKQRDEQHHTTMTRTIGLP
eukprot:4751514-Prorocentrum_lima.AAC.1